MNNNWDFGWEAISALVAIIALIALIIVEWEKIKIYNDLFIRILLVFFYMAITGFLIFQPFFIWRFLALIMTTIYGVLLGSVIEYQRSLPENFNISKFILIMIFPGLIGIIIGTIIAVD